jgi:hypothetical protein
MACAWAASAGATIYTMTITGQVEGTSYVIGDRTYNGIDGDGLFGAAGASLAGDTYTAVFVADSTLGESFSNDYLALVGGSQNGASSPIISATLTINGHTMTFSPGWADEILYDYSYWVNNPAHANIQAIGQVWEQSGEELTAGRESFNSFSSADGGTTALLSDGTVSMTPVPPANILVPEPATWMMLTLGIGLLGIALRQRGPITVRPHQQVNQGQAVLQAVTGLPLTML